jgi:tetratricopeptide (TPR) repeat protein
MLGRRAVDLPVLFVVTYREDEVGAGHPLRQALGNLATSNGASWIGLEPLSFDAVRRLAEPSGASAEEIYALTAGNPFFVTEALAAPPGALSTSVRLAVLARASRLSSRAREALDAAAIVPGRAESWLLDALCEPAPVDIDECLGAGVLILDSGDFLFRHELARRAIEHEVPPARARRLHGTAVSALAARPGTDPARIAHHAERAGDEATLASASAAACRLALARGAGTEAVHHGERAYAVSAQLSSDDLADLSLDLAQALHIAGRGDEGIDLATRAVEHWRRCGDERREAVALNALGTLYVGRGRTAEGMAAAARAVEILERHPPDAALAAAYVRLTSLHMLARNRDAAAQWGERAVALATRVGDQAVLARALTEYGIADVMDSRFEGLERIHEAIAIGREHELPQVVANALSQIGSGCGELRRYDLAVPALTEGIAFATDRNLEFLRQYLVSWMSRCHFDLGKWDDAEANAADVFAAARTGIGRFVALNTLGWLRARRGDGDV